MTTLSVLGRFVALGSFAVLVGPVSCGGDGAADTSASGAALCRQTVDKLRSCKLTTDTASGCTDASISGSQQECMARCMLKAKCQTVRAVLCDDPTGVDPNDGAVACVLTCLPSDDFECADGSGSYSESDECDGFSDCDDESDEAGCEPTVCDDGTEYPVFFRCDGAPDCPDGEDEQDCPEESSGSAGPPVRIDCG